MNTPRKPFDIATLRQSAGTGATGVRPKILVVDDEERIVNSLRALLRLQYDVVTVTDAHQALALLKQGQFHLLISDQRMPEMQGVELLRHAKEISPCTVRVLLTGYSDMAAMIGSVNDGEVFRFLNKPWNNQELQSIVAEAVNIGVELTDAFSAPTQSLASAATAPVMADGKNKIIVLEEKPDLFRQVQDMQPACQVFPARDQGEALDLMANHEISVIVSMLELRRKQDIGFFALLKREHPQIVTIIFAQSPDSEAVLELINEARIFRYMFMPLKAGLLEQNLKSAIVQYNQYKAAPKLLLQQSVRNEAKDLGAIVATPLVAKMKSLKSFFTGKGVSVA